MQKGANLERQYEDRVQKMLSELREVSRLILNYIFANDAFVLYFHCNYCVFWLICLKLHNPGV